MAKTTTEAGEVVQAIRAWAAYRGEPLIRPAVTSPRGDVLHRHVVLLLLDARDRLALAPWLHALVGTSPRPHVVFDLYVGRPRRRPHPSRLQGLDVAVISRLTEAGEFLRAESWLAVADVLVSVARAREPAEVRRARGWLRFWQGRFEEAEACAQGRSAEDALLRGLVAWACGRHGMDAPWESLARLTLDARMACAMRVEAALATGNRVLAARMVGPPDRAQDDRWVWRAVTDRQRARVREDAHALSGPTGHDVTRGADGVRRWGLGRSSMYLMHALESLLHKVNECDDEQGALAGVCAWARQFAHADVVFVMAAEDGRVLGGDGGRRDILTVEERLAITRSATAMTLKRDDGLVVSAPIRYGGARIGAMVLLGPAERQATMTEAAAAVAAVSASVVRARLTSLALSGNGEALARDILGRSPAIRVVREAITRAAVTPFPVLIEGESGTGKELAARALHRLSARRDRRLAALNCAALSDELAEAELFGHARGAFTGAVAPRAGLFEDAHGGTLFLDEVGELSPRAQAKLLRALQEREVRRVGENASRAVDVRVVAATNRSLQEMSAAGGFREDLLFRLAVIRLRLPPLRERSEDIPALAHVFWRAMLADANKRAVLGADAVARLVCHHWPGNVRELQNVIAGLVVLAPGRGRVGVRHVEHVLSAFGAKPIEPPMSLASARLQTERRVIAAALARHRGRRVAAARELGVTRQGLSKAVRRLRLLPPDDLARGVA